MLLRASGCRVIGLDVSPRRVEQALTNGAVAAFAGEGPAIEEAVLKATRGRGCDAILITAATKSNAPVELAARIARDRAKVVMVGVTGMDIPRNDYYHKELTFIVSRSYGPVGTTRSSKRRVTTTRSDMSAGPSRETWKRFSTCVPWGRSNRRH